MSTAATEASLAAPSSILRFAASVPVITLPDDDDFDRLRAHLRERLPSEIAAIRGRASRLDLGGRELKLFDVRRLLTLLREDFGVEITGLYVSSAAMQRYAERELKLKLFPIDAAEPAPAPPVAEVEPLPAPSFPDPAPAAESVDVPVDTSVVTPPAAEPSPPVDEVAAPAPQRPVALPRPDEGRRTQSLHRTLRSGAVVRFDGDLYVFGDVNPGAHVIATGNVVVLGTLKGMAHAGAAGDDSAFILAFQIRATQLRIGRKIAIPPERPEANSFGPELATVTPDGQIGIEPYRGRVKT